MPKWLSKQLSLFDLLGLRPKKAAPVKPRSKRPTRRRKAPSDPELFSIWSALAKQWFPTHDELFSYTVVWSNRRQLRTLASCNIDRKKVRVAQELRAPEHSRWLSPLLYHEMCHAVLGDSVRQKGERARWHGPEFRALERRNAEVAELDRWIKIGGWAKAVRSHRAKAAHARRKAATNRKLAS